MNQPRPSDADVKRVMSETGMGELQAYRHLQSRMILQANLRRNPSPYPLGKSQNEA
jgi:hypothetical protein